METIHNRCALMASSGAYLHWYRKYGFEDAEMLEALEDLHIYLDEAADLFHAPC